MVPRRARLEKVERAFIATYKQLLSFINESFEVSPRPPQKGKRLYQLPRTAAPQRGPKPVLRRGNALNAQPDAMSIAVAKPIKVQDSRSHKISPVYKKTFFATRFRGVANHDDEKDIHDLLESLSHGHAKAVQNYAAC